MLLKERGQGRMEKNLLILNAVLIKQPVALIKCLDMLVINERM